MGSEKKRCGRNAMLCCGIICGTISSVMAIAFIISVLVNNQQEPIDFIPFVPDYVTDEYIATDYVTDYVLTSTIRGIAIICSGRNCKTVKPDNDGNIVIDGNHL